MRKSNKERLKMILEITGSIISITALILSVYTFVYQKQKDQLNQDDVKINEVLNSAPELSFRYFFFEGSGFAQCEFFDEDLRIKTTAIQELKGRLNLDLSGGTYTLKNFIYIKIINKLKEICSKRDPLQNNIKDLSFILVVNMSNREVIINSINYSNSQRDTLLNINLPRCSGLVIAYSFKLLDKNPKEELLMPNSVTCSWIFKTKKYSQEYQIHPKSANTTGIRIDMAKESIIFSEPPLLRQQ